MRCPICKKEVKQIDEDGIICSNCGFDDIRLEFINDEECIFWENYVVKPCQYAYKLNRKLQLKIESLQKKITEHEKKDLGRTTPIEKGRDKKIENPKMEIKNGWNYDDPIAHPNYSEGNCNGTKFSISDISVVMTDAKKATVYFLVKKISNKSWGTEADSFAVRYRVKDENGVIVLNETKSISGLMPGDVSREKIELTGVVPGKYSIDIVSYN